MRAATPFSIIAMVSAVFFLFRLSGQPGLFLKVVVRTLIRLKDTFSKRSRGYFRSQTARRTCEMLV